MAKRPIVMIHGYSADSGAFDRWRTVLAGWGYSPEQMHVCNYLSLSDEVTIPHLAMSFHEALQLQPGLNNGETFDAMVHSTGMLVLRTWAVLYPESRHRLKHLVGFAPASFGSPIAHKGRSYLGRAIKGNPAQGPDFREAGDQILDALELGSAFTWDLAQVDLLGDKAFYGTSKDAPFVSVFCGTDGYKGIMSVVNEPGTDGTVRLAGAALNTRKFELDLRSSITWGKRDRFRVAPWSNRNIPVVAVEDTDHGTITAAPTPRLKELVKTALEVETRAEHDAWLAAVRAHNEDVVAKPGRSWQQLVFRVVDGLGVPVPQYFVDFHYRSGEEWLSAFAKNAPISVHAYSSDPSLRCFHLDLEKMRELGDDWALTLKVNTGSRFVKAVGWIDWGLKGLADAVDAVAAVRIVKRDGVDFFHPNTTTLVQITIDQVTTEDDAQVRLVDFVDRRERVAAEVRERKAAEEVARNRAEKELEADIERLNMELEERVEEERRRQA